MLQSRSLGIGFSPLERRRELIVELAVLAERCGYDRVSLGEGWTWDVHLMLAEIAAKTSRLELVSAVVSAYSRTPGSIAMSAATLAAQSEGRYVLGLGASSQALTEGFHDVAYEQPVSQLRKTVQDTRALLTGGRIEMTRDVRPLRLGADEFPSPSIYIAALSPRALRLVGELAEGWLPFLVPPAQLPAFVDGIEGGRSRRSADLTPAIRVLPAVPTVVSADVSHARDVMSSMLTTSLLAMGEFYCPFLESIGFSAEVAAIRAANERPGDGIIPEAGERLLREQTIVGAPEEARLRLAEWYESGADAPLLTLPPGAPAELLRETVEVMAPGA